jgi:hypothetical protein
MSRKDEGKSLLGLEEKFDLHAEEFLKLKQQDIIEAETPELE